MVIAGSVSWRYFRPPTGSTKSERVRLAVLPFQNLTGDPNNRYLAGQLAKDGHAGVQLKDVERNKFISVAVDGRVKEYGAIAKRKHSGTQ